MAQVFTPMTYAAALRAVGPGIAFQIRNVMSAGLSRAVKYAVEDFTSRGVGKGIFGTSPSGVVSQRMITRTPVSIKGNRFVGGLKAQGFAALQEGGGRTKPHRIPKGGEAMQSFQGTNVFSGKQVFTKVVNHPGSAVPRYPFLQKAMERAQIGPALDQALTRYLNQKIG